MRAIFETFLRYRYLLYNLITRDLKVKYRRSVLGILWSLLNPIMLMLILSAVFSRIFRSGTEYFPVYLILGQTLFSFFNGATSSALFSVVGASALIKKIYVPKYIFPLEKIMFEFVNLLFSLVAAFLMIIIFGVPFSWTMLMFPIPLIAMLIFVIGLGMFLASLCVFFRDIQYLYSVILVAWTYLTPLFYPIEMLEGSWIYWIIKYQPLTCFITYFRNVVIYNTLPTLELNLLCFGYALFALIFGFWFFKKNQDKFILHI
ncbi:MAG: ABC transporter permease [Oscillospiraceae bacterium]|nr:ABC transporter permease [Oscillospiraceae bacterium]